MADADISKALNRWTKAVSSRSLEAVLACYAEEATLLGTLSPMLRTTKTDISAYFQEFLAKPVLGVRVEKDHPRVFGSIAINSGLYSFTVEEEHGPKELNARFTFVYRKEGAHWKIIEHHSSLLPG